MQKLLLPVAAVECGAAFAPQYRWRMKGAFAVGQAIPELSRGLQGGRAGCQNTVVGVLIGSDFQNKAGSFK